MNAKSKKETNAIEKLVETVIEKPKSEKELLNAYLLSVDSFLESDKTLSTTFTEVLPILDKMNLKDRANWLLKNVGQKVADRYNCYVSISKTKSTLQFKYKCNGEKNSAAHRCYAYLLMTDDEKQEKLEAEAQKKSDLRAKEKAEKEQLKRDSEELAKKKADEAEAEKARAEHNAKHAGKSVPQNLSNPKRLSSEVQDPAAWPFPHGMKLAKEVLDYPKKPIPEGTYAENVEGDEETGTVSEATAEGDYVAIGDYDAINDEIDTWQEIVLEMFDNIALCPFSSLLEELKNRIDARLIQLSGDNHE